MIAPEYRYEAQVIRWIDGDTVDLRVDLGFYMWMEGRFRLYGIDTPERGQEDYQEAIDFVNRVAPVGTRVVIQTYKSADKYGRFLAIIESASAFNVNQALMDEGLAYGYFGGTKR